MAGSLPRPAGFVAPIRAGGNASLTKLRQTGGMTLLRPLGLAALAALALAGCAPALSPEAQCFAAATVEYRAAWRAAEALRADLARGYALHPVALPVTRAVSCSWQGTREICLHTGREEVALPVAADRAALEARLAAAEARMDTLRPAAMAAAAPCGYGDWTGS